MGRREAPFLVADDAIGEDEEDEFYSERSSSRQRRPWRWMAGAGVVSAFVLVAVCLTAFRQTAISRGFPKRAVELNKVASNNHCHTAAPGESCHVDVTWAMTTGITNHPEWYRVSCSWLKPEDTFEEFQACVYRINQTSCPLPCNPKKKKGHGKKKALRIAKTTLPEDAPKAIHKRPTNAILPEHSHGPKAMHKVMHKRPLHHILRKRHKGRRRHDPCHIAKKGEDCYEAVINTMVMVRSGQSRFAHLSRNSSFEEVQEALHKSPLENNCPRPCRCHTVRPGEPCYQHVFWAKKQGIRQKPDWYIGLTPHSSMEEVQAYLHKDAKGVCPLPCSGVTRETQGHHGLMKFGAEFSPAMHCHTAKIGSMCYDKVMYAMHKGIFEHPHWYPGLSTLSSFEDFQGLLYKSQPQWGCTKPCHCSTAKKGDKCHDNVKWVLHEGIPRHPKWYPELTERSRWETVQERLHEDENTTCPTPCTPKVWGTPSLFCFAVFRSKGYELDLVKSQVEKGVGIFACDEFAVLSDKVLKVTETINTLIIPPCEKVGVSKDGTAANTLVFMQAWNVIWEDTRYKAHDWVIKADPDAVLIVDRLRTHLKPQTGKNVFIKNCMKYTGPGWPMMFGSLEAFSHDAIETYFKGSERCQKELEWEAWGEDLFMGNCLTLLGAEDHFDGGIIGDNVCKGANCADGTTAVYHPFKSPEEWFRCYDEAQETLFKKK